MNLDTLRRELLSEHGELRARLAGIEHRCFEIERTGGADAEEKAKQLRADFKSLRGALLAHIAREDQVLEPILRDVDAWGQQRAELLVKEHRAEHDTMLSAMVAASAMSRPDQLAGLGRALARELRAHMQEEERYLLAPDVLTDDIVRIAVID